MVVSDKGAASALPFLSAPFATAQRYHARSLSRAWRRGRLALLSIGIPAVRTVDEEQVQRAFAEAGRAVTKRTAPGMPSPISEFAMPPVSAPKLPAPATTKAEQQKDSADVFGEAKPLPGV